MNLHEAANRLRILADAYEGGRVEEAREPGDPAYIVTASELEAVTFAAAFLGVFQESLEANPHLEV